MGGRLEARDECQLARAGGEDVLVAVQLLLSLLTDLHEDAEDNQSINQSINQLSLCSCF